MPTLECISKNKVVNHHQEVPFRVLERQYSFDEQWWIWLRLEAPLQQQSSRKWD